MSYNHPKQITDGVHNHGSQFVQSSIHGNVYISNPGLFNQEDALTAREKWQMQIPGKDPHAWLRIISRISDYNQDKEQRRISSTRLAGTTKWFLDHAIFQEWLACPKTSSLWFSGPLGSGKTIISSTVINLLQKSTEDQNAAVLFFYFDASYSNRTKILYALQSLLQQQLKHILETNDMRYPWGVERKIIDFFNPNGPQPDWEDIKDIFTDLFFAIPRAYYVIDGLHEVDEHEIRQIMSLFKSLLKDGTTQKVFVSSREELGWDVKLSLDHHINITFSDTSEDLQRFIQSEISGTLECRKPLTQNTYVESQVVQTLFRDAHGMFLWVRLQIEALRCCITDEEILQALPNLPPDLQSTYKRCLDRVSKPVVHITLQILRWVSCSLRALHIEELAEVVSFESSNHRLDANITYSRNAIISSCSNLIVVDGYDECVRLTHPSVKQFLSRQADPDTQEALLNLEQANLKCAEACIHYLNLDDFKLQLQQSRQPIVGFQAPGSLLRDLPLGNITNKTLSKFFPLSKDRPWVVHSPKFVPKPKEIEKYKFLEYAIEHWAPHTKYIAYNSILWEEFKVLALQPNIPWPVHPWTTDGQSVIRHLHGLLIYASRERHLPLLRLLLDQVQGSTIKQFCDLPSAEHDGLNALQVASRLGFADVTTLLSRVCDVDYQGPSSKPALLHAIEKNNLETARILLQVEDKRMSSKSKSMTTAVRTAVEHGSAEVLALLLDSYGTRKFKPRELSALVPSAALRGHEVVVKLLVGRPGIDINTRDCSGKTALSAAAYGGHEAIVKLLVQYVGIDLNSRDSWGQSALSIAAMQGHEGVVELLARHPGIDLNSRDSWSRTALSIAAREGHEAVVKLLVQQQDIDIDSKDHFGQTALSIAAENSKEAVVEILVQHPHIDINSTDYYGITAVSWAEKRGNEGITKLLRAGNGWERLQKLPPEFLAAPTYLEKFEIANLEP